MERSRLMKHRLVFLGRRSSVGIGNMLSALLRALKRDFSMEGIKFDFTICGLGPLAPGHKREKVSIDETQVSVSGWEVFGRYWKHALGFASGQQKRF